MTAVAAPITDWSDLIPHLRAVDGARHNLAAGMPLAVPALDDAVRAAYRTAVADPGFAARARNYHATAGDELLRERLAERYATRFGLPVTKANVLVTPGAQTAFHYLSLLVAARDRALLMFGPEYPGYRGNPGTRYEMVPAEVRPAGADRFRYAPPAGAVHAGVGAVVLSRPGNPAGDIVGDAELAALAGDCAALDALLVVDNAYAPVLPGLAFRDLGLPWGPNVVHVHSLSKAGLAGERVGFVLAPEPVVAELAAVQERVGIFPPQLVQAALSVLLRDDAFVTLCRRELRPAYLSRHRLVADVLAERMTVPFSLHAADGGQFRWLHVPGLRTPTAELFHVLRERGVLVAPAAPFYLPGLHGTDHARTCVRIGITAPEPALTAGLATLAEVVREHH